MTGLLLGLYDWQHELDLLMSDTTAPPPSVAEYRCQFCSATSPAPEWKQNGDECPRCGRLYDVDALLTQDAGD